MWSLCTLQRGSLYFNFYFNSLIVFLIPSLLIYYTTLLLFAPPKTEQV